MSQYVQIDRNGNPHEGTNNDKPLHHTGKHRGGIFIYSLDKEKRLSGVFESLNCQIHKNRQFETLPINPYGFLCGSAGIKTFGKHFIQEDTVKHQVNNTAQIHDQDGESIDPYGFEKCPAQFKSKDD